MLNYTIFIFIIHDLIGNQIISLDNLIIMLFFFDDYKILKFN